MVMRHSGSKEAAMEIVEQSVPQAVERSRSSWRNSWLQDHTFGSVTRSFSFA